MKKIFILILLAASVVTFNACKKSGVAESKPANPNKSSLNQVARSASFGTTQVWLVGLGQCLPSPYNCGSDVVIIGKRKLSDELHLAIGGGPADIGKFFTDFTKQDVFPASTTVTQKQIDDLASGTYNIIEYTDQEDPYKKYYLVGPADNLNPENPEYVLSITFAP